MSLSDAKCCAFQCGSLVSAGAIVGASVNADVVPTRIITITSGAGGVNSYNSNVVAGLTLNAFVFVQQISSGAVVVPVVVDTYEPGGAGTGFVIRITADAPMPPNAVFDCYIAKY